MNGPVAYLTTHDGERVTCLIERLGPTKWQAVPVRHVSVAELAGGCVNGMPAGHSMDFRYGTDEDEEE